MIQSLDSMAPRARIIYLAGALSLAVNDGRFSEALILKKKLDEAWKQERKSEISEINENRS